MPVFLEPNQKFPIVLDIDRDKPADVRPTFYARSLSMREQLSLSAEMDASLQHEETEAIFAATCELLGRYLVGWTNMGEFEFGCDVREFLSHGEARELLRKVMTNQHLSSDEKKSTA